MLSTWKCINILRVGTLTCFFHCHLPSIEGVVMWSVCVCVCVCVCVYTHICVWCAWIHAKKETGHSLLSGGISVALCVLTALKIIPRKKCRLGKVILVLGKSKNFGRLCLGNKMTSLKSCWIWFLIGNWPTNSVSVIQSNLLWL